MSTGRSGRDQNQQIAIWTQYVATTFTLTRQRVVFNGKMRKVFLANTDEIKQRTNLKCVLVVLDEWHGAL